MAGSPRSTPTPNVARMITEEIRFGWKVDRYG